VGCLICIKKLSVPRGIGIGEPGLGTGELQKLELGNKYELNIRGREEERRRIDQRTTIERLEPTVIVPGTP
jgi:hypothetical protein